MDDRERKPDNRNNKKRNYQLYIILAIVAAVTVALITGLDSLVKKSTTKKVTYDEFVEAVEEKGRFRKDFQRKSNLYADR